jgi:hypothetical protein
MRTLILFLFVTSCGALETEEKPDDCRGEIELSPIQITKEFGHTYFESKPIGDPTQCATVDTYFAYKAGSTAPDNCNDGYVLDGGIINKALANDLIAGETYSVRACAYRDEDGYMSSGVTRTFTAE